MDTTEFSVKKSKNPAWGYEITAKGFHNIAPTLEAAVGYLKWRFGHRVKIRVYDDKNHWKFFFPSEEVTKF